MSKSSDKNTKARDFAAHLSIGGSAAGGLIGSGIGALLGPEFSAAGLVAGTSLGGSLPIVLGKNPDWLSLFGEELTVEALIVAKLTKDFSYSVIHESSLVKKTRENSHARIILLEEIRKRDFARLTPGATFDWLKKHIPDIRKDLHSATRPEKLVESLEILERLDEPVRISCECIEPASVATLRSLQNPDRFGVRLEIDYDDTSGVYQIGRVDDLKDRFDFVITASAPFFLFGATKSNIKNNYRLDFEVHGEEQVVLRRRELNRAKTSKIHVFGDSSAEEQYLVDQKVYESTDFVSHKYYEELTALLEKLNPGELVIAWEPLASVLSRNVWIKRSEDVFINWISMFCHKKWNGKLKKEHEAFRYLFVYEWLYCRENTEWAVNLLLNDTHFKERFALGAGIAGSESVSALLPSPPSR